MVQRNLRGVTIECVRGNIAHQPDVAAVVNAANAQLRSGGGVAGAIHFAAGPGLETECRALAPIRPGQAVITGAHDLPNRFVIHCLGPVYGHDEPADELLASCYRNALRLAARDDAGSVAFPAISTGSFGYPLEAAAEIAVSTVVACVLQAKAPAVNRIRFVLFDATAERIFSELIDRLVPQAQAGDR